MIIVYQSLESVGTKDKTASTVLSGNSFKNRTQSNVENIYSLNSNREFSFQKPVYDLSAKKSIFETQKIQFATSIESKQFSENFKSKQDAIELNNFLLGIIDTIVKSTMNRTYVDDGNSLGFCRPPDIIVLGEVFLTGIDHIGDYEVIGGMDPTGDARHRFTVLKRKWLNDDDSQNIEVFAYDEESSSNKDENSKCMMMRIMGWLVAFVHTPNKICNKESQVIQYIKKNVDRVLGSKNGLGLDLLIGDTNQKSVDNVKDYMGNYNNSVWSNSIVNRKQEVVGFGGCHSFSINGTNSGFDQHYDIACSHHVSLKIMDGKVNGLPMSLLKEEQEPAFVFHGLTDKFTTLNNKAYAYSDHNGVIVEVLRHKDSFGQMEKRRKIIRKKFIDSRAVVLSTNKRKREFLEEDEPAIQKKRKLED
ncbi:MAG: hypothetical protein ISR72_03470 [Methylobacter sp.]|nr:hypothetical protein [Methylobacter sp.]